MRSWRRINCQSQNPWTNYIGTPRRRLDMGYEDKKKRTDYRVPKSTLRNGSLYSMSVDAYVHHKLEHYKITQNILFSLLATVSSAKWRSHSSLKSDYVLRWNINRRGFWWESAKERGHLEDQGLDGRMGTEWLLGRLAGGGRWARMAQDRDLWRAAVNTVMNLRVLAPLS
jgi:hypothetical protein